jgi:hypothetical protein
MKKKLDNKEELLRAEYGSDKTPLIIGNVEIPAYVLNNGMRVLSQNGIQKAIGFSGTSGDWLSKFISTRQIKPFISAGLSEALSKRVVFQRIGAGGSVSDTYGYDATILIDVCDAIIEAKNAGNLSPKYLIYAERAEMILRSVAKTGIIALVDEATGYQQFREKDALQLFLQRFLEDEKGKWVRTFPPEFFEAIFKMKGWTWHQASTKKPQVVGHYINNYVYSRIAPKILEELRQRAPKDERGKRKGKFTQWINPEYGHPKLKEHLNTLTAFARAAGFNWKNWERMVARAFPKFEADGSQLLELEFKEDDI